VCVFNHNLGENGKKRKSLGSVKANRWIVICKLSSAKYPKLQTWKGTKFNKASRCHWRCRPM